MINATKLERDIPMKENIIANRLCIYCQQSLVWRRWRAVSLESVRFVLVALSFSLFLFEKRRKRKYARTEIFVEVNLTFTPDSNSGLKLRRLLGYPSYPIRASADVPESAILYEVWD
jgi:hypothetical protein